MGGSPAVNVWPLPFAADIEPSAALSADGLAAAADALGTAVEGATAEGARPDVAALAAAAGVPLPDALARYVASWPDEALNALVKVAHAAAGAGRSLQLGWKSSDRPVEVVAPDAWPRDEGPVPVIIVGPHP